jgi:membrane protease YdiL (CAAX protease family)
MELDALLQALLVILFVGGLSLLAHWGRKNRAAEIGLIVTLLFVSFLVMALGALVALAGWSSVIPATSDLPPEFSASSAVVLVFAGLAGLALCIPPLRKVIGHRPTTAGYYDTTNLGREGFGTAGRSPGGWWSDPPILFALWMFDLVLGSNVIVLLAFTLMPDVVGSALASAGRLSPFTVFIGQLPLAVIALCGVGLGVRRNLRETIARLGYGPISPPQLGVVALFIVGAILLSSAADALFATLQPDLYEQVGEVSESLFSPEGLSPVSAILFALLIGVGAGLGEETLFRGALQPALGITLTSLLFASMHVQYGPSLLLGYLFVVSVGLGLLRRHINTTASFLAHAGYNSLGVLLAYFFGV